MSDQTEAGKVTVEFRHNSSSRWIPLNHWETPRAIAELNARLGWQKYRAVLSVKQEGNDQ